jgi:FkbM family methyltransferase
MSRLFGSDASGVRARTLTAGPLAATVGDETVQRAWRWHEFRPRWVPSRIAAAIARGGLASDGAIVTMDVGAGIVMQLDLADLVECTIAMNGEWEGLIFDAVAPLVQSGSTVLDVGAHVGYASLRLAQWVGDAGRVVALEPMPSHVAAVRRNAELSGVSGRISVHNVAASDRAGRASFNVGLRSNTGTGALASGDVGPGAMAVETVILDDWLTAHAPAEIALCKLDIEGAELLALRGLRRTLKAHRIRALLVEVHATLLPHFGATVGDVTTLLDAHGYRVLWWDQPGQFSPRIPASGPEYALALAPGVAAPGATA